MTEAFPKMRPYGSGLHATFSRLDNIDIVGGCKNAKTAELPNPVGKGEFRFAVHFGSFRRLFQKRGTQNDKTGTDLGNDHRSSRERPLCQNRDWRNAKTFASFWSVRFLDPKRLKVKIPEVCGSRKVPSWKLHSEVQDWPLWIKPFCERKLGPTQAKKITTGWQLCSILELKRQGEVEGQQDRCPDGRSRVCPGAYPNNLSFWCGKPVMLGELRKSWVTRDL